MVTSTAPSAWRAISPVSSVTWWRPNENVFLIDFTLSSCDGRCAARCRGPSRGLREGRPPKRKTPRALARSTRGSCSSGASLLAQAEALDERAVGLDVAALEVIEEAAARAHHLEQAAARMEILDVRLEVVGE